MTGNTSKFQGHIKVSTLKKLKTQECYTGGRHEIHKQDTFHNDNVTQDTMQQC